MTHSHTPGPWHVENYSIVDPQGETILVKGVAIPGGPESDSDVQQGRANAHLIAAAPELLEALRECAKVTCKGECDNSQDWHSAKCEQAQAAIAKAEGR